MSHFSPQYRQFFANFIELVDNCIKEKKMAMEECRTEASIGVEYSESIHGSSEDENTNSASIKTPAQADGCSPSQRRKRKRISPHSTPKVADGKVQDAIAKEQKHANFITHVH